MPSLLLPRRGMALLIRGGEEIRTLALELAASVLVDEERVFWVDGGNRFDPYHLAGAAKQLGIDPAPLLRRLFVARPFTIHQLGAMMSRRLVPALEKDPEALAVISDPLALCFDPDISPDDAERVVRRMAEAIRHLRKAGCRILIVCPDLPVDRSRSNLIRRLESAANRTLRRVNLHGKNPGHINDAPRRGAGPLAEIPSGPSKGRPGRPRRVVG